MQHALLGDPLLAWRDDSTLQIGWGGHCVVVESAPPELPKWLGLLHGEAAQDDVIRKARKFGLTRKRALKVLQDLRAAGLIGGNPQVRVRVESRSLVGEALREALGVAGVELVASADVVVFPQGQVPSLVAAPAARRLLPVWFGPRAVHVGPVIDDVRGPCPQCVDRRWADADPLWSHLVAQANSVGSWSHPAQMVQAAGLIAMLAPARDAVGLEMIVDPARPGPRWRVWEPHPDCACQGARNERGTR